MRWSSIGSFGQAGILVATLFQVQPRGSWDASARTTGDTNLFAMRNRGGKGLIAFYIGLLISYPIVPWLFSLTHNWMYLVFGSLLWLSAGIQLAYLPRKPKAVRLAGAELTLVFRKGQKVLDLADIIRAEWRVSSLGCSTIFKCVDGDVIMAYLLDARILHELLRRASLAKPELDWRQLFDQGPSALRSAGRQMMMTKNEMADYRLSLWKVAARPGISEKNLAGIRIDRTVYESIFWGYRLRKAIPSVVVPYEQPR